MRLSLACSCAALLFACSGGVTPEAARTTRPVLAEPEPERAPPAPTRPPDPFEVVASIDAEGATVVRLPGGPRGTHTADLVEAGASYGIVEQQSLPNERHVPLEELVVRDGDCGGSPACLHFLGYEWPPVSGPGGGNDRVEVELSSAAAPGALRMGEWRYLRFRIRVDPETAPLLPGADTLIAQVWQSHRVEAHPLAPPFRIGLARRAGDPGSAQLSFRYSNDEGRAGLHSEELELGEWTTFHIALRPLPVDPEGELGTILIWRDQDLDFDFDESVSPRNSVTRVAWGYAPRNVTDGNRCTAPAGICVSDRFSVRVGIYRSQGQGEPALSRTSFRMDDLRLAVDSGSI